MDKKELKWYVTPEVEIMDGEFESELLAGSAETNPFDDSTGDTEEIE